MRSIQRIKWTAFIFVLSVFSALIFFSCSGEKKKEQNGIILARIDDVTISVDEFVRRAEMTIRPAYCKGDNNLHKKIILNSLIAEKMLALEAGDLDDSDQSKYIKSYIQGRQEQAMREWLLHTEGFEKVELDDAEIQKVYDVAGRTYRIQYFNIPDQQTALLLKNNDKGKKRSFNELYHRLWQADDIPEREISWNSQEPDLIHKALFSDSIAKNTVIGPIRINDNDHIIMKVTGWTDEKVISEQARQQRWKEVKDKLMTEKALQIYDSYVVSIMAGKKIEFDRQIFNKIVALIGPIYMRSSKEKQELFMDAAFNRSGENPELDYLSEGINRILDEPFFRVEDQVWTVGDFKTELQRHPLVFRKNLPENTKFAEHFKYAVIDMIRDRYLTQEAYKKGYDRVESVKEYTKMWKDALLAEYQKNKYLNEKIPASSDSLNTLIVINDYLNPYIEQLQNKYSDRIRVNVDAFNRIKLSRIDMIAIQSNVPFPLMVPGFPQITTDSKLDYGEKM